MPFLGRPKMPNLTVPDCRIKVFLRLRPSARPSKTIHIDEKTNTVRIDWQKYNAGGAPKHYTDQMVFPFDHVIQTTSQSSVYDICCKRLVEEALCGFNGTIMAYGQTGSGKTFTMTGDPKPFGGEYRGVTPRVIQRLYAEKEAKPQQKIVIYVSYLEIYNEGIYDLLAKPPGISGHVVQLLEDFEGHQELRGANKIKCHNAEEALAFFFEGEKHRCNAAHILNENSSRSHCIFTLYIERHTGPRMFQETTLAKLNLVDLAGTERTKKIKPEGKSMREVTCINKSLSFLEQTIWSLRLSSVEHIPYRQSPLTTVLRDSLGGNCKTIMIACAWSEDFCLDETISTCRFAQRVRYLKTIPVVNKKWTTAAVERRYVRQISELKQELALRDALSGRTNISYDDLTEDQREELKEKINAYLTEEADIDSVPVVNIKQVKELFSLFKEAQLSLRAELEKMLVGFKGDPALAPPEEEPFPDPCDGPLAVGLLAPFGLDVGLAPPGARPVSPVTTRQDPHPDDLLGVLREPEFDPAKVPACIWAEGSKGRCAAFTEYKHGTTDGIDQDTYMKNKHDEIRQKRRHARDLCNSVNGYKLEIEELRNLLAAENQRILELKQAAEKAAKEAAESSGPKDAAPPKGKGKAVAPKGEPKGKAAASKGESGALKKEQKGGVVAPTGEPGAPDSPQADPFINEETIKMMQRYKFLKASYVRDLSELKETKGEIEVLRKEMQDSKKKLLLSFYRWFETICQFKGEKDGGEFMLSTLDDKYVPIPEDPRSPLFTGPYIPPDKLPAAK